MALAWVAQQLALALVSLELVAVVLVGAIF
jgi:hypothetical protein